MMTLSFVNIQLFLFGTLNNKTFMQHKFSSNMKKVNENEFNKNLLPA